MGGFFAIESGPVVIRNGGQMRGNDRRLSIALTSRALEEVLRGLPTEDLDLLVEALIDELGNRSFLPPVADDIVRMVPAPSNSTVPRACRAG
jgi:hypothetical protein